MHEWQTNCFLKSLDPQVLGCYSLAAEGAALMTALHACDME